MLRELEIHCANILFQPGKAAGAGNRDYIIVTADEPSQRKLSGSTVFFLGDLTQAFGSGQILPELLSLEWGLATTPIIRGQVIKPPETPA